MNKLFVLSVLGSGILAAQMLDAAAGEVTVTVEKSTDLVSWSDASTDISDVVVDVSSTEPYFRVKIVPTDAGDPEYSSAVQLTTTDPGDEVDVALRSSDDLSTWAVDAVSPPAYDVSGGKKFFEVSSRTHYDDEITVSSGSTPHAPVVMITDDFIIGKYEVTLGEWLETYNWAIANGYEFSGTHSGCNLDHPVQNVNWYDVIKWCNAKSEMQQPPLDPVYYTDGTQTTVYKTGNVKVLSSYVDTASEGYRLPLNDEWEYAARGGSSGSDTTYSGSDDADTVAIYLSNSMGGECNLYLGLGTYPVASLAANELGAYDMSGNVMELVFDGPDADTKYSRGGSFYSDGGTELPVTNADQTPAFTTKGANMGFRIARNAPPLLMMMEASVSSSLTLSAPASSSSTIEKPKKIKKPKPRNKFDR